MPKTLGQLQEELQQVQAAFLKRYQPDNELFDQDWRHDMFTLVEEWKRVESEMRAIGEDPANWASTQAPHHSEVP